MPNVRADGQVFIGCYAPAELVAKVRARAEAEGVKLSTVIRAALTAYVEEK